MTKPLPTALAATIAGIALAITYILSPMTVWLSVAMVPLFVFAGWGLPREERRWVWSLLACGLAVRLLAIIVLLLATDHYYGNFASFFFDDDGRASKLRSTWMRNAWLGLPIEPFAYHAFARDYGWTSYLNVIAYLQYLLGPAPYGIHLLNTGFFMAAAVTLHRLARRAYGPLAACFGLAFLLFSPGLVLWSVSAMKESLQYLVLAVSVVAAIAALRGGWGARRVISAGLAVVAFAALWTVKREIALLTLATIAIGAAVAFVIRWRNLLLASPVILAIVAIVAWAALQQAPVQERAAALISRAVTLHIGHVNTTGHGFKLLDDRFYSDFYYLPGFDQSLSPPEVARFVVRALVSLVLVPLPWQSFSRSEILFVPAQMFWYCLLALAAAGVVTALRRDALVTAVLIVGLALFGAARAVSEGNIGTLVRHRDILLPFLAWLSGVGAARGFAWLASLVHDAKPIPAGAPSHPAASRTFSAWVEDSWVCRSIAVFVRARTPGVDLGVQDAEEADTLRRLAMLARDSWLFSLMSRIISAWSEAWTSRTINRRLAAWSVAQRFGALGCTIAVAVAIETLFAARQPLGVSELGLGIRGLLLAMAAVFITTNKAAEAAWHASRFRTLETAR